MQYPLAGSPDESYQVLPDLIDLPEQGFDAIHLPEIQVSDNEQLVFEFIDRPRGHQQEAAEVGVASSS